MADQSAYAKQWAKIVAKAWLDEDYKQRLLTDAASVMKEEGMEVPEGVKLNVVEATDTETWMVLPPKPENGQIEEAQEHLAAGMLPTFIPICGG